MTELERVKQELYDYLIQIGFSHETAKETVDRFEKITGYWDGKPSRVVAKDGVILYLE